MPDFDGGHYFLTVLAPIRIDTLHDAIPGRSRSHRASLAQKLALLATGRQTAASPPDAWPSPFAANSLNHFARLVIIDAPAFNGRLSPDALVSEARCIDALVPQPDDRLTTPFLLFAADIDAQGLDGPEAALRRYTDSLWTTMRDDLAVIFGHCRGFDSGGDAAAYHAWIKRCQIETTMPFNDYWLDDDLGHASGALATGGAIAAALVAVGALGLWLVAVVLNGLLHAGGAHGTFVDAVAGLTAWGVIVVPVLLAILALVVFALYRSVMKAGGSAFPTAPGSDLPSVLKALFLQQQFTRFAIEAQGLDDAALHARFGGFLAAVAPSAATPRQAAGTIAAPPVAWPR